MSEFKQEICRKIRETIDEFGRCCLKDAVIIGQNDFDTVSDLKCIKTPTISTLTLGNVDFKVARFFEDI